ncbi:MAG: TIGR03915 family putative DNA repair protein [Pyrinomonadaceae bacterium]
MLQVNFDSTFEDWRSAARNLLGQRVTPGDVIWSPGAQGRLFETVKGGRSNGGGLSVPKAFIKLAEFVACYDDPERWALLYRLLYRLAFEEKYLLEIETDVDVRDAKAMAKAVRRDIHKFHAFVRFRRIECDGEEIYGAWHEPHHFCVELATPFFERRFGEMKFSIFTPKGCAHWDKQELTFSPPAAKSSAPAADEMEDFWLLYYRSIYNPFRLKIKAMKRELPVRHWPTLPEAVLIPELIRQAKY